MRVKVCGQELFAQIVPEGEWGLGVWRGEALRERGWRRGRRSNYWGRRKGRVGEEGFRGRKMVGSKRPGARERRRGKAATGFAWARHSKVMMRARTRYSLLLVLLLTLAASYAYLSFRPNYALYDALVDLELLSSRQTIANSSHSRYVLFKQLRGAGFNNQVCGAEHPSRSLLYCPSRSKRYCCFTTLLCSHPESMSINPSSGVLEEKSPSSLSLLSSGALQRAP